MRVSLFMVSILGGTALFAQQIHPEEAGLDQSIRELYSHLSVLSHDSLEGRNTAQDGQRKAANYLIDRLTEYGLEPGFTDSNGVKGYIQAWDFVKRFGDKNQYYPQSWNIIALLPATVPSDEYLVLSAHYDHLGIRNDTVCNGADDNGSGTSALLEMARLMKESKQQRLRNVLFVFFSGEEKGLLGSKHFAEFPAVPLHQIVANLNVDMIGRADSAHSADSNYVYVIGSDRISIRLDSLLRVANQAWFPLELDYTFNDPEDPQRLYERSDHVHFARNGIPVVFFFSGLHPDYHKHSDDIEKINFEILYRRMRLVLRLATMLAASDTPLLTD